MAVKERFQNPIVGDQLKLRLFAYNSNNYRNFFSVVKVDIYALDDTKTSANPLGKRFVKTVESEDITVDSTGQYSLTLDLEQVTYTIGNFLDVWTVEVEEGESPSQIENNFEIFADLWFTNVIPIVYGFDFTFRPNKIRKGSKNYLIIDITPNVPKSSDLEKYYQNLAITSPISISIEQECGECIPVEQDLRLVVDCEVVELREKCVGYYFLDTTELDCGIYNVWFQMDFGNTVHISDKQQIQIY